MKYLLLLLPIMVLLNSCLENKDDMAVIDGAAHVTADPSLCVTFPPHCIPALANEDIGNKSYGYVEMDFSLGSPLLTADSFSQLSILLRVQNGTPSYYYSCQIRTQAIVSPVTLLTSRIVVGISGINPTSPTLFTSYPQTEVVSNQLAYSFIGDHTLGCELVLVGANSIIRLYLDDVLLTSYVLGSNLLLDVGPLKLTTSTGKVGVGVMVISTNPPPPATATIPPADNIKVHDFRYYDVKP